MSDGIINTGAIASGTINIPAGSDLSLIEGALIVMRETSGHRTLADVALEAVKRLKGAK